MKIKTKKSGSRSLFKIAMNTYEFHLSLLQKKKKGKKSLPKNLLYPEKTRYEEDPYTEDE